MKATSKTAPVRKKTKLIEPSHRALDISGVVLIALGIFSLIALLSANSGVIGQALSGIFRVVFGVGAWAVPFVLALFGFCLLRGRNLAIRHLGWGLLLLFLALLGGLAKPHDGDYFDPVTVSPTGGYIGAMIGFTFASLLGAGKIVGILALGIVGAILCIDMPVREALSRARAAALRPRYSDTSEGDEPVEMRPKSRRSRDQGGEPESSSDLTSASESLVEHAEEPRPRKQPIIRDGGDRPIALAGEAETPKEGYQLPPINLLSEAILNPKRSPAEMQKNIETLENTLEQFGIEATVVEVATGPTVTRYEVQLGAGVRVARITALADNIAMDLAASQVRVEAPIPGKAAIGVEVPNSTPSMVTLRELCETPEFKNHPSRLYIALGKDVSGVNKYADLTKMPHILIGGATNSGKSIGLATLITSLLMRNTPKDVRLVMIDPKRVELTLFDHVPHLMCPVIKDVKEAPGVLRAVWREMDRRYDLFSEQGVRNIDGWNAKATFQDKMPYIVVVIDELADLMIQAKAEVETTIVRLAQLARAVGIHLVIATQRPSVDVITGLIKANIPSRIAFSVASQIDSRTIIDMKGAENLIGKGDMLYSPIDANKPLRVQGCYVSEKEIDAVCEFWRKQQSPDYSLNPVEAVQDREKEGGNFGEDNDPFWEESVRWVVDRGQASTSMLQRKFSIGFQRASRLLDQMEERGIVGPRDGPRPREVLMNPRDVDELFGKNHINPGDRMGMDD